MMLSGFVLVLALPMATPHGWKYHVPLGNPGPGKILYWANVGGVVPHSAAVLLVGVSTEIPGQEFVAAS